jgi:hypothetical protein
MLDNTLLWYLKMHNYNDTFHTYKTDINSFCHLKNYLAMFKMHFINMFLNISQRVIEEMCVCLRAIGQVILSGEFFLHIFQGHHAIFCGLFNDVFST